MPSECGAQPAPRPDVEDSADEDRVLFAIRDIVLDQDDPGSIGYDLDCFDTDSQEAAQQGETQCFPPSGGGVPTDGPNGVDNVFGDDFYPLVGAALSINEIGKLLVDENDPDVELTFEEKANQVQASGRGTLLVIIDGWNGTLNDPSMTASIAQAAYGTPCADDMGTPPENLVWMPHEGESGTLMIDDGGEMVEAPPPAWDGNDCWWIREDAFVTASDEFEISDDQAYVNEGEAVIDIPPRKTIQFFAGPVGVEVKLTGAVSTAIVSDDFDALTDMTVAGRWARDDLRSTGENLGVCQFCSTMETLDNSLLSESDVRSNPDDDPSPNLECNAISMGVRFETGVRGTYVDRAEGPVLPNPCENGLATPCCEETGDPEPDGGCP
ncbi:MAG: hypothetical protein ACODAG_12450 [Myxococcota bacterium]